MSTPRSLTLDDIPEEDRCYSGDRARAAAFCVAFKRDGPEEVMTDSKIKVWGTRSPRELLAEAVRYTVDHRSGVRDGLPVRSMELSADGPLLSIRMGFGRRYAEEGVHRTIRLEVPEPKRATWES